VYSAGSVYVADTGNNRIQKFAPMNPQPVPPSGNAPKDLNDDGLYEDIIGNRVHDFNDMVLFFNQMDWIAGNESVGAFDFSKTVGSISMISSWSSTHCKDRGSTPCDLPYARKSDRPGSSIREIMRSQG
jgi:PKD repeat protein